LRNGRHDLDSHQDREAEVIVTQPFRKGRTFVLPFLLLRTAAFGFGVCVELQNF